MEIFSALLALCAGNSPVPVNSPHKGQWRGVLYVFFDLRLNIRLSNNRSAGDLRRYRGHYDVTLMERLLCHVASQVRAEFQSNTLITRLRSLMLSFLHNWLSPVAFKNFNRASQYSCGYSKCPLLIWDKTYISMCFIITKMHLHVMCLYFIH